MNNSEIYALSPQALDSFTSKGAFITTSGAQDNAMTFAWGGIGMMWKKPVIIVPVRVSRYTFEQMGIDIPFGISIPAIGKMKQELAICGSKSGRDCDKFEQARLERKIAKSITVPLIEGCQIYYECVTRGIYESSFFLLSQEVTEQSYPGNPMRDPHSFFVGEILEAYQV